MLPSKEAFFSWSGGKDSTLALHILLEEANIDVVCLLTTVNSHYQRIAMHGVREQLLVQQAESIGIPLNIVYLPEMPSMEIYEQIIGNEFKRLHSAGITHGVFGDIFLSDLKLYREQQLSRYQLNAEFPLWGRSSRSIIEQFISLGYKTIVVCAQEGLEDFCGRVIDLDFLNDLPEHIDPCGENGEFHSFVFDGPLFKKPICFELGEKVYRTFEHPVDKGQPAGFWYVDLLPKTSF